MMDLTIVDLAGVRVFLNSNLMEKRTWKERLFTRPWRPHVTHCPSGQVITLHGGLCMHPWLWNNFQKEWEKLSA